MLLIDCAHWDLTPAMRSLLSPLELHFCEWNKQCILLCWAFCLRRAAATNLHCRGICRHSASTCTTCFASHVFVHTLPGAQQQCSVSSVSWWEAVQTGALTAAWAEDHYVVQHSRACQTRQNYNGANGLIGSVLFRMLLVFKQFKITL